MLSFLAVYRGHVHCIKPQNQHRYSALSRFKTQATRPARSVACSCRRVTTPRRVLCHALSGQNDGILHDVRHRAWCGPTAYQPWHAPEKEYTHCRCEHEHVLCRFSACLTSFARTPIWQAMAPVQVAGLRGRVLALPTMARQRTQYFAMHALGLFSEIDFWENFAVEKKCQTLEIDFGINFVLLHSESTNKKNTKIHGACTSAGAETSTTRACFVLFTGTAGAETLPAVSTAFHSANSASCS